MKTFDSASFQTHVSSLSTFTFFSHKRRIQLLFLIFLLFKQILLQSIFQTHLYFLSSAVLAKDKIPSQNKLRKTLKIWPWEMYFQSSYPSKTLSPSHSLPLIRNYPQTCLSSLQALTLSSNPSTKVNMKYCSLYSLNPSNLHTLTPTLLSTSPSSHTPNAISTFLA